MTMYFMPHLHGTREYMSNFESGPINILIVHGIKFIYMCFDKIRYLKK